MVPGYYVDLQNVDVAAAVHALEVVKIKAHSLLESLETEGTSSDPRILSAIKLAKELAGDPASLLLMKADQLFQTLGFAEVAIVEGQKAQRIEKLVRKTSKIKEVDEH